MFPKSVSGTSLNILKNKAQYMLAELFFVTAQACQNGQCPTVKESLTVATTVTTINSTQVAPVVFVATAPRLARWRFPNIFHRPIAIGCYGGKCK
jgi:hypothetical protein